MRVSLGFPVENYGHPHCEWGLDISGAAPGFVSILK